jgi:mannose-6-phosphate isomerase-like protein (cupin superfamily)
MIIASADTSTAVTTASGTKLWTLLDTTGKGQGRMSLAVETLRPDQHTEPHWHAHLEEIYYILTGTGRMEIGDEAQEVRAGDAILIPINQVHCLHNTGDDDLALLCAVSPPWYPKDYFSVEKEEQ